MGSCLTIFYGYWSSCPRAMCFARCPAWCKTLLPVAWGSHIEGFYSRGSEASHTVDAVSELKSDLIFGVYPKTDLTSGRRASLKELHHPLVEFLKDVALQEARIFRLDGHFKVQAYDQDGQGCEYATVSYGYDVITQSWHP